MLTKEEQNINALKAAYYCLKYSGCSSNIWSTYNQYQMPPVEMLKKEGAISVR